MIIFSDGIYDHLKFTALVGLPSAAFAYFLTMVIWDFPDVILGILVGIDAYMGLVIHNSSRTYSRHVRRYAGTLDLEEDEDGKKTFLLVLDHDPQDLQDADELVFKVNELK